MVHIIFDLILILANIWVIFDEDSPKALKYLALLGVILLLVYVMIQILEMNGII